MKTVVLIAIMALVSTGVFLALPVNKTYAECFIFCTTIVQQGAPPYNTSLVEELAQDHEKADSAIRLFGNDHLKSVWQSGKQVNQFTTEEKISLADAAKKTNDFYTGLDQASERVTNKLAESLH